MLEEEAGIGLRKGHERPRVLAFCPPRPQIWWVNCKISKSICYTFLFNAWNRCKISEDHFGKRFLASALHNDNNTLPYIYVVFSKGTETLYRSSSENASEVVADGTIRPRVMLAHRQGHLRTQDLNATLRYFLFFPLDLWYVS